MTIIEHIRALRATILWSFFIVLLGFAFCLFFFDSIITFLYSPLLPLSGVENPEQSISSLGDTLFITNLLEGFTTKISISLLGGIIVAIPALVFVILRFIFPALLPKEKRIILLSLCFCTFFALVGFYYGYVIILPLAVRFLTSTGFIPSDVGVLLNYNKTVHFIFQFILVMLLVFQFPVVLDVLLALKVLHRKPLLKASRYIIVAIFIFSAVVTPPDVFSQISIALPLIMLYYLAIAVAYVFRFVAD